LNSTARDEIKTAAEPDPRFAVASSPVMALPVLPSPSNFLGVALVINRSRDGPRFVFHYPAHVTAGAPSRSGGGDDIDADDDDALLAARLAGFEASASSIPPAVDLAQWNHDDHLVTDSGTQIVPWEHVAGFPTKDLENILTPARAYHKRLFQVSLDPLYCVSYPIYVPENGVWRRKKKQQQRQDTGASKKDDDGAAAAAADADAATGGVRSADKTASDADQLEGRDPTCKPASKPAEEAEDKKSSMTMFNLVFFLQPKEHEVRDLVDVMFVHIIKKINKAYKYCQQRSDFVWKESKRILALKDKGREDSGDPLSYVCTPRCPLLSLTRLRRAKNELPVGGNPVELLPGGIDAVHL
jgi:hypothetical protein